jgi:branched-chain amino acid transport system permease protein
LAASTLTPGRKINFAPWIIIAVVVAVVVWRIAYLSGVDPRFNPAYFVRALIESVKLGSLYALIALGYTMVYGIIRLINFAHGEVFMVGGFLTYFMFSATPYPFLPSLLFSLAIAFGIMKVVELWRGKLFNDPVTLGAGIVALAVFTWLLSSRQLNLLLALGASMMLTAVVGLLIDRVAYFPLRRAPRNSLLITAIAISFFLQNFGLLVFTNKQTPFRPETPLTQQVILNIGAGQVTTNHLAWAIPLITLVLVVVLTLFVNRTKLGKAMRASAQDPEVAQMMGVSVNRVISTTFLLGCILAAAGAAMWGLNFGSISQPATMGILPGIKAFSAAVIGGIGSLPGAVVGAMVIAFLENFLTAIFPAIKTQTVNFAGITEFKDTFAFVLLIVILLIRPSGIMGEDLSEKV